MQSREKRANRTSLSPKVSSHNSTIHCHTCAHLMSVPGGNVTRGTLGNWLNKEMPSLRQQCGTTDMMSLLLDTLDPKERKEEQDERWRKLDGDADAKINSWTSGWQGFMKKWMTPFQIFVIFFGITFFIYMAFFHKEPTEENASAGEL